MQEKTWYYEKWGGRHASFHPRRSFNSRILPLPSTGGAKKLLKKGRAGLLLETAKKVPDQLLVCGIGDL